jgi:hypothetical protein
MLRVANSAPDKSKLFTPERLSSQKVQKAVKLTSREVVGLPHQIEAPKFNIVNDGKLASAKVIQPVLLSPFCKNVNPSKSIF